MTDSELILQNGLKLLGMPDAAESVYQKLAIYARMLADKNRVMNLTSVSDPDGIYCRHFLESIALYLIAPPSECDVIDVGCGAGFPGLPLKMYCDGAGLPFNLTLCDSTTKKIDFLRDVCRETETKASFLPERAEDAAHGVHRESFDLAVSRAVARTDVLCELCLPFVRVGGRMAAVKSGAAETEAVQAKNAAAVLGANFSKCDFYETGHSPGLFVLTVNKISHTPTVYPRKFAQIKSKPL